MIRSEAEDARQDPAALASFKALRLNMGLSDMSQAQLIDADAWERAERMTVQETDLDSYVLGLDLGQNAAMSAAAAYFRTGKLEAMACFPELPSLAARGLADGVGNLYQKMADRGELLQLGRRVSDIKLLLGECLNLWGTPGAIVTDRWREAELRDALEGRQVSQLRVDRPGAGIQGWGAGR